MAPRCRRPSTPPTAQRGVALVVVLLILLVVIVLGVGGAQIALLSERTARYDRDYLIASQAAEAALMDAEFDIRGEVLIDPAAPTLGMLPTVRSAKFNQTDFGIFASGCSSQASTRGLCLPNADTVKPVWAEVNFLGDSTSGSPRSVEYGTFTGRTYDAGGGIRPVHSPRYVIELIDDRTPGANAAVGKVAKMYRITALGFGPRDDVQVVMQTVFRKEASRP